MAEIHHAQVFFSGRVQGVGFRYATLQVAREFEVAGYVTNLPDGRVQIEAEGAEEEVNAFLKELEDKMQGFIRKGDRSDRKRAGQFSGFVIG